MGSIIFFIMAFFGWFILTVIFNWCDDYYRRKNKTCKIPYLSGKRKRKMHGKMKKFFDIMEVKQTAVGFMQGAFLELFISAVVPMRTFKIIG